MKSNSKTLLLGRWLGTILITTALIPLAVLAQPCAFTLPAAPNNTNTLLRGFAVPNGTNTTVWFQWGIVGLGYPSNTAPQDVGSSTAVVYVTNTISLVLLTGVQYQCQLVASNSLGVTYGWEQRFGMGVPVAWSAGTSNNPSDMMDFGQSMVSASLTDAVAIAGGGWHNLGCCPYSGIQKQ